MSEIIKGLTSALGEMPRARLLKAALKALDLSQEEVARVKGLDAGYLRHILNERQPSEQYLNAVEEYIEEVLSTSKAAA